MKQLKNAEQSRCRKKHIISLFVFHLLQTPKILLSQIINQNMHAEQKYNPSLQIYQIEFKHTELSIDLHLCKNQIITQKFKFANMQSNNYLLDDKQKIRMYIPELCILLLLYNLSSKIPKNHKFHIHTIISYLCPQQLIVRFRFKFSTKTINQRQNRILAYDIIKPDKKIIRQNRSNQIKSVQISNSNNNNNYFTILSTPLPMLLLQLQLVVIKHIVMFTLSLVFFPSYRILAYDIIKPDKKIIRQNRSNQIKSVQISNSNNNNNYFTILSTPLPMLLLQLQLVVIKHIVMFTLSLVFFPSYRILAYDIIKTDKKII
eukprot:TRINITY_DN2396_c0_g1_i10.p2 TRINITY_DN2396_c0_g1~~TRINITY_DN2396_c0_g1_i10.p2  ORF type:complete len:317 (+),score=-30.10 TRINITY_DN2396_c0_g1_i10:265-1215(+)